MPIPPPVATTSCAPDDDTTWGVQLASSVPAITLNEFDEFDTTSYGGDVTDDTSIQSEDTYEEFNISELSQVTSSFDLMEDKEVLAESNIQAMATI